MSIGITETNNRLKKRSEKKSEKSRRRKKTPLPLHCKFTCFTGFRLESLRLCYHSGFKPNPRTAANPSTSVPTPVNPDANTAQSDALAVADKGKERQETRRRKEEKRERKSEKRDAKLRKLGGTDEGDGRRSGPGRGRSQSRSPPPNRRDSYEDRSHRRHSRSRSPHRRTSLPDSRRRNSRSRSPPPRRPYDASEMDKERERDRRRWEVNAARERPGTGHWGR
jgi:hypothetical protein